MKALRLVGGALVLASCFGFGFSWRDLQNGSLPSTRSVGSLFGAQAPKSNVSATQVFRTAYARIQSDYYQKVDPTKLKYAGIDGLMGALGDPHTIFMEPKQAKEFALETSANFVGVGARLQPDPLGAKVVVVFDDGPAGRAGLRVGDTVTGVDNESMVGKTVEDVVSRIRGEEGTSVKLQLVRPGVDKPVRLTIRRAKVIAPTVESSVIAGTKVGYITVAMFSEPTADQFDKALNKIDAHKPEGLVIDVRNNPGGLLETAVEMLSRFAEDKVVVKMRMRDGREEVAKTYMGQKRTFRYPVVVLINEESASAAEIFGGALRDYKLTTLVGEHSYGKASVQNVYALIDGSSAKITIARYFLPGGSDIGRRVDADGQYISGGLLPDVKAKVNEDAPFLYGDPKGDAQLAKALEVIRTKNGK